MQAATQVSENHAKSTTQRYAKCIAVSKRIRWDIDRDVNQAKADAEYFVINAGRKFSPAEQTIGDVLQKAYRWQYIASGVQEPRFVEVLKALVTPAQMERIGKALAPILAYVGH